MPLLPSPAWSKWSRISSSILPVNIAKRASCAASCRTVVVTSSTVGILQPYQIVRSHRRSASVCDEYGSFCFLSQTERTSRPRADTHVHNRQGQNCDRKLKYAERNGVTNARKLRCAVSQGESERERERRRQRRVAKILTSSLLRSSCPSVVHVGSVLPCVPGTMRVDGASPH